MNSAFLTLLLREIEADLVGLRVATIAAPEPDVIVVTFARAERALVLDAGIDAPRVGWEAMRVPPRATRFAATAVARLAGASVMRIAQPFGDRWAQFEFDNGLRLVWENFGRRANIMLLDGGVIAACVREYPPAADITRAIRIGDVYPPPPDGPLRDDVARPSADGFASFAEAGKAWGAATRSRAERLRILVVLRAHWRERDRAARRALTAVDRDLAWASRYGEYRRSAEALVASFRMIERGASEARVPDPADAETMLVIPLDPAKSARENSDRYFRDAKRAERGHAALEVRRAMLAANAERAAAELARWDGAAGDAFLDGDDADGAKHAALRAAAIAAGLVE
ncbi:MAG: NFACT family protein, partial [bacterium]